jgi:3-methyladenine DNA glycosylase AlkC
MTASVPPTDIKRPTDYFGVPLAELLAKKISLVYPAFNAGAFVQNVKANCKELSLTQRVELIADNLKDQLPTNFAKDIAILHKIMGPENPNETGMFTNYYWLLPVAKFIEKYGLDNYSESITAIGEITKRNTGEYAIRPFIRKYPKETMKQMKAWARSENFHLRRLASEGLRPKLPWAQKLDLFIENPKPVFEILTILKADEIKFVKKSVANHLTDYLKVNPRAAREFLNQLKDTDNEHTLWIIKHATRKHSRAI